MKKLNKAIHKQIASSKNICILISDPDEDAVGSGLAMQEILEQMGKKASLISNFIISDYSYLPRFKKYTVAKVLEYDFGHHDLVIILDSGDLFRILDPDPKLSSFGLEKKLPFIINIDHHPGNTSFGDINWISTDVSSTGEALYTIFNKEIKITKSLATNLLASIIGDTGCFKYPNTKASTFRISSDLIKHGADHPLLIKHIFYSMKDKIFKLNQEGIKNIKTERMGEFNVMYTILEPSKFGLKDASRKQRYLIQEAIRTQANIDFSLVIIKLRNNITRLSFRSTEMKINHLAKHFGGGGHKLAAGSVTDLSPKEVLTELRNILKN